MTTPSITVRIAATRHGSRLRENRQALFLQDGLAVTRGLGDNQGKYAITHVASGWAVLDGIRTQRDAKAILLRFLPIGDWTRSRTDITSDRALKNAAVLLRDDLRREGLIPLGRDMLGRPVTPR
jgi:hypothetical protein